MKECQHLMSMSHCVVTQGTCAGCLLALIIEGACRYIFSRLTRVVKDHRKRNITVRITLTIDPEGGCSVAHFLGCQLPHGIFLKYYYAIKTIVVLPCHKIYTNYRLCLYEHRFSFNNKNHLLFPVVYYLYVIAIICFMF